MTVLGYTAKDNWNYKQLNSNLVLADLDDPIIPTRGPLCERRGGKGRTREMATWKRLTAGGGRNPWVRERKPLEIEKGRKMDFPLNT